jgi:hypothetical protein
MQTGTNSSPAFPRKRLLFGDGLASPMPLQLRTHLPSGRKTNLLLLSPDELERIGYALCNPLAPHVAGALSGACKQLWMALKKPLEALRRSSALANDLCAVALKPAEEQQLDLIDDVYPDFDADLGPPQLGMSCAEVHASTSLAWQHPQLTAARCETLGMLLCTHALPRLRTLRVGFARATLHPGTGVRHSISEDASKAPQSLGDSLGACSLHTLRALHFTGHVGPAGMAAIAAGLARCSLPNLGTLGLASCAIGDDGLRALVALLPSLVSLHALYLSGNAIGDEGIEGMKSLPLDKLITLSELDLSDNRIGCIGSDHLCSILLCGKLPGLDTLYLGSNPARAEKRELVLTVLEERRWDAYDWPD